MAKNRNIPKIISGIAATISLIIASWLFVSQFWFWMFFEIAAALLVTAGCSGEWWLHHHPAGRKKREKDEHHKLESRFIALVVFGVTMELFSLGHSIREGVKIESEVESEKLLVAAIGTTNAQLKADNLVLQSNVAALVLQVMDASNNIVKNDVRNWPISEMNAIVWFTVMGTNFDELTNLTSRREAEMSLWKNEREGVSVDTLEAGNGDIWGRVFRPTLGLIDRRVYRVQLRSLNFSIATGIKPPPVKTIDDIHMVHVDLNFLPRDSEIANGRVILTVNNLTKYFDVPSQNDTNSNMGWRNDFQCWFVATNGIQSSEKQFLYLRQ